MFGLIPVHVRALTYCLIAVIAAALWQRLVHLPLKDERKRWTIAWIVLTSAAFLTGNFPVFAAITLVVCLVLRRLPDANAAVLTIALYPLMPLVPYVIPGFAGINQILSLDWSRLLALFLLLPALLKSHDGPGDPPPRQPVFRNAVDVLVIGYCAWQFLLAFVHRPTGTDMLRAAAEVVLFQFVPYLGISRLLRTWSQFRLAIIALTFTGIFEACLGLIEQRTHWWFYEGLAASLGMHLEGTVFFEYVQRYGLLRTRGSVDGGVGLVMMLGLAGTIALWRMGLIRGWRFIATCVLLIVPIIFTGTRGTWLSCAAMLAVLAGFRFIKSPGRFLAVALLIGFAVPTVQDYFLNTNDEFGTFDYRAQLLRAGLPMTLDHPLFGYGTLQAIFQSGKLEALRQGQGIIDVVNTYLSEALILGLPGILMFVGAQLCALWIVLKRLQADGESEFHPETAAFLTSLMLSITLMLFTTSMIGHIWIYRLTLLAMCSAYACLPQDAPADVLVPEAAPVVRMRSRLTRTALRRA